MAIGIFSIFLVFGVVSFSSLRVSVTVDEAVFRLMSDLDYVRGKTLFSQFEERYGIHFEPDKYTLFQGSAYNPSDTDNKVVALNEQLELYDITLAGGGSDVVFQRVRGETSTSGTVSIRDIKNSSSAATIVISPSGASGKMSPTFFPDTSAFVDLRHIHLDLGWSIQGATTLTLTFLDAVNGDVIFDIPMADYFNAGQTDFYWKSPLTVHGESQTVEINSHTLDAFNTLLSIHRDWRYNTKPVRISIDGKNIVDHYAQNLLNIGPFANSMYIQ